MNREEIIALAREAGIIPTFSGHPDHPETDAEGRPKFWAGVNQITLERFAALVAAHKREECATIVEADKVLEPKTPYQIQYNRGITAVAEKIRARGNHV